MNNQERGNAKDASSAVVAGGASTIEAMQVHGVYHATLVGPHEARRAWYEQRRDHLMHTLRDKPGMQATVINILRRNEYAVPSPEAETLWKWAQPPCTLFTPLQLMLLGQLYAEPFVVKWEDEYKNLITTVGKNEMLDKYFAGSSYTAALNMFLKGTGSAAAGDTMASHAGWLEVGLANAPAYSGNRPAPAFSSASAGAKAITSAQNFTFTSGGTVAGSCFVQGGSATKDNTTGTIVSAGDFTGGNKVVANTDQLNVSWSVSV